MNGNLRDRAAPKVSTPWLALLCTVAWGVAVTSAGAIGIWLAIGGTAIALGIAILGLDPPSRALLRPSGKRVLLGAAVGGLMTAGTYLLYPVFVRLFPFVAPDAAHLYSAFRAPSLAIASAALLPVIVGEELVWRGVVQDALVLRLGTWEGAVLGAVLYALIHVLLGSPLLVMATLGCGLVWAGLRAVSGSLVPTLVAHLVWDVFVLVALPLDSGAARPL